MTKSHPAFDVQPHITLCHHGCFHLHLGATTVTLSVDGLRALAQVTRNAVVAMQEGASSGRHGGERGFH